MLTVHIYFRDLIEIKLSDKKKSTEILLQMASEEILFLMEITKDRGEHNATEKS